MQGCGIDGNMGKIPDPRFHQRPFNKMIPLSLRDWAAGFSTKLSLLGEARTSVVSGPGALCRCLSPRGINAAPEMLHLGFWLSNGTAFSRMARSESFSGKSKLTYTPTMLRVLGGVLRIAPTMS